MAEGLALLASVADSLASETVAATGVGAAARGLTTGEAAAAVAHGVEAETKGATTAPEAPESEDAKSKNKFGRKKHFAEQLLQCLDDSSLHAVIAWSTDGQTVVIHNWEAFCNDAIPQYFPSKMQSSHEDHDKIKKRKATFLKQTNNYGFAVVHNTELNSCSFSRPDFQRDHRAEALDIDPRARPPPTHKKVKTPLRVLEGINGSEVFSPNPASNSLKRPRQEQHVQVSRTTSTFEDPTTEVCGSQPCKLILVSAWAGKKAGEDPEPPGPGRKRCNHSEITNVKNSRGIVSGTCLDDCGSTIRQCPNCLDWENHNNFYRHHARCPATAGIAQDLKKDTQGSKNAATMTTTTKTTVTETTITVTTTTTTTSVDIQP
jgi:hypothetical protein